MSNLPVKLSLTITLTLVLAIALPAHAQKIETKRVDRIVAVINDAVILESELLRRVVPIAFEMSKGNSADMKKSIARLKQKLLEEMISEELVVQAAAKSKVRVSSAQVQSAYEEMKRRQDTDDATFMAELAKQGYTMEGYRKDITRQMLRMQAVTRLVRPKVKVTDEDVRARYDEMGRRSQAVTKARLQHVLIHLPPKSSDAQLNAAKQKAAKVIQLARAGTPFAELAKNYSDDEGTRDRGGDLGWIERGTLDAEWETIVFSMAKGDVRGPVKGDTGLHVFHVSDIDKSARQAFDKIKEKIRTQLLRREMDRQTRLWIEELRAKAHIEIKHL